MTNFYENKGTVFKCGVCGNPIYHGDNYCRDERDIAYCIKCDTIKSNMDDGGGVR